MVEVLGREEEIGLEDLWRIVRRQYWVVLGILVLVVGGVAAYTFRQTPTWEASALVLIEEENADPFQSQLLGIRRDELETTMRVVTTRPIVSAVTEELDLHFGVLQPAHVPRGHLFSEIELARAASEAVYQMERIGEDRWRMVKLEPEETEPLRAEFTAGERVGVEGGYVVLAAADSLLEAGIEPPSQIRVAVVPFDDAVANLQSSLIVTRPGPDASLFRIAWRSTDRLLVRNAVNAVASSFLASRQSNQKTQARSTVAFLRDQTAQIHRQLEAAEEELQAFREEEQVVALEAEADEQVRRLAELQARRTELAAERTALGNLMQTIETSSPVGQADYRELVAFPTFLQNQTVQSLVESLTEAEGRRTELRERWRPGHPGIVALDSRIHEMEDRLGEIGRNYLRSLGDEIASLDAVLARFGSDLEQIPGKEIQFARLERETRLLAELHTFLEQRLKEAEIAEAVEDPSVRVVEAAVLPREPVSPRPFRNLTLAGFVGLMLGVGIAFVREAMDRAIHADDDVDQILEVPVLSRVPPVKEIEGKKHGREKALVTRLASRSLPAEAYRALRTNMVYATSSRGPCREVVVSSPGARDGKSVTAANLAITFAQQGQRTILVDADMRRSVLHLMFGLDRKPGLSDFLAGRAALDEVTRGTRTEKLYVVPAGVTPPNPSELLGSPLMEVLIQKARESYDAIIFDSPPVLAVTDASVLGRKLDGVVLVVRADRTHKKAARDTLDQLRRVGARILGVVVNDAKANGRYGYSYRYYYDYYGEEEDGARRGLGRLLPFVGD